MNHQSTIHRATIRTTLAGTLPPGSPTSCVYIVRDGNTVFYVGQTGTGITFRLAEHIGLSGYAQSELGVLILANAPQSDTWCIELWTIASYLATFGDSLPISDLNDLEEAFITHHRPCLNRRDNPTPTMLPAQYAHAVLPPPENPYADELARRMGFDDE